MLDEFNKNDRTSNVARENLRRIITERKISKRWLSHQTGAGDKAVSRFLDGANISLDTFLKFEEVLRLRPGELLGNHSPNGELENLLVRAAQRGAHIATHGGPTAADFLRWYSQSGGTVSLIEDISNYYDVYFEPKDHGPLVEVARLGSKGLAARTIGTDDPRRATAMIEENRPFCEQTADSQRHVFSGGTVTDERHGEWRREDGSIERNHFLRLSRIGDWNGIPVVVTFAEMYQDSNP